MPISIPMLLSSLLVLFKRGSRGAARVGVGSPAAAAALAVAAGCLAASPLLAVGLVCRKTLDNTVPGQHATVDGKVSAHHERTHGGVLLGQHVRCVCKIRLILATVHENQASVTAAVTVTLVHRVLPSTTPAKTCWDERDIVSHTFQLQPRFLIKKQCGMGGKWIVDGGHPVVSPSPRLSPCRFHDAN